MAKRKRLGIIYTYNENWIGGTYYIQNLISALSLLPDIRQPDVIVFSNSRKEFNELKNITNYPHLSYSYLQSRYELVFRFLLKIGLRFPFKYPDSHVDYLFQGRKIASLDKIRTEKFIHWIPDFQEEFLSHLFTEKQLEQRRAKNSRIANSKNRLILSSNDALNHLKQFFPGYTCLPRVVQFAVFHSPKTVSINSNEPFFYCPNQFWEHKNHQYLANVWRLLKEEPPAPTTLYFSGKENDTRASNNHITNLKSSISEYGLENRIKFLGFISKEELADRLKSCLAIIQPSLFEGWSTVVEDAKAMNSFIFASNIHVHLEQLKDYPNKVFFDPKNPEDLATKLRAFISNPPQIIDYNYDHNRRLFAENFAKILE